MGRSFLKVPEDSLKWLGGKPVHTAPGLGTARNAVAAFPSRGWPIRVGQSGLPMPSVSLDVAPCRGPGSQTTGPTGQQQKKHALPGIGRARRDVFVCLLQIMALSPRSVKLDCPGPNRTEEPSMSPKGAFVFVRISDNSKASPGGGPGHGWDSQFGLGNLPVGPTPAAGFPWLRPNHYRLPAAMTVGGWYPSLRPFR